MKISVLIAVLPGISLAFTPSAFQVERSSKVVLAMRETRNDRNTMINDNFLRPFGTMLVAASLVFNPGAVGAVENGSFSLSPVVSSSLHVAEEIKLLDMSLPTYGSLSSSDPKANKDSIDFVKPDKEDKNSGAAAAAYKKKAGVATKSKPMKEQKPAPERKVIVREPFVKAERVVEPKEPGNDEVRNNFKSKPVYIQKEVVSIEDKKKEKEEKKAEVKSGKKEKAAVITSEEKDDGLSLKDVTVVNMEMPSYGDSTTKKSKSAFAL